MIKLCKKRQTASFLHTVLTVLFYKEGANKCEA